MRLLIFVFLFIAFASCEEDKVYSPKPRMYPRIDFPDKTYTAFDKEYCNFTFQVPTYFEVERQEVFFEEKVPSDCWFDLENKGLKTTIHCSYYPIGTPADLDTFVNDAFRLASEHNKKANYSEEVEIITPSGIKGLLFNIEGPVASPINFFLTDEKDHFFRGSLYFNAKVNRDSVAPVLEFINADIEKMIETFEFQ